MHILRCDDKTSPLCTYSAAPARGLPSKGETRRKSDNALLTTMRIKHPPSMHILRCEDKTSPQPPSKGETRRKSDNALLITND